MTNPRGHREAQPHATKRLPISIPAAVDLRFAVVALVGAFALVYGLAGAPVYTDAYYHFNAAVRLARGDGLTEPYLWTYIGAPDALPASGVFPSHLYWMPLTSIVTGAGMALLNAPGSYPAAQWPLALLLAGTAGVGFWLGGKLGGTPRHAWTAGLLTLFSPFFARFWGTIDTFAPYGLLGALCLVTLGLSVEAHRSTPTMRFQRRAAAFSAFSGVLAALAHVTRNDGLLLLLVGVLVLAWEFVAQRRAENRRAIFASLRLCLFALCAAYLLVMLPWFVRNLQAVGAPLPFGGTQAIWFREYNELFNFPPDAAPSHLFADGADAFIASRREAFDNNLATFIAVEGMIVLTPLMLIGLWVRRRDSFVRPFWLYALGLHIAMTLVFPYPGYRGGLFHSAAALVPWWAALGIVGLDRVVDWVRRRRPRWNARTAKQVFSTALVALALALTATIGARGRVPPSSGSVPALYAELRQHLPADARLLVNDPAELYYYTGFGGAVTPNEDARVLPEIARRYDIDYLLVKIEGGIPNLPAPLATSIEAAPSFLTPIPLDDPNARLYAIRR